MALLPVKLISLPYCFFFPPRRERAISDLANNVPNRLLDEAFFPVSQAAHRELFDWMGFQEDALFSFDGRNRCQWICFNWTASPGYKLLGDVVRLNIIPRRGMGFATRLVSLMLLGTFCLGFYQKLLIHRLKGSTAENYHIHKSRHCIRSAGSPKQWWWRLTSTIDRNWSLTRDLAVPWLHIQSSTCDWVARTWARERFLILTESPPFHELWRQRFTPCLR